MGTGSVRSGGAPAAFGVAIAELPRALVSSPTGLSFIYRALGEVRRAADAGEVILVLTDDAGRRQCFRSGREPIRSAWASGVCHGGSVGLHYDRGGAPADVEAVVVDLAVVALRLDQSRHDARHDALTDLLNRRAFDEVVTTACAQSMRHGWQFAVLLIDLNRFKQVNDRFGHERGDLVLRAVGRELRSQLRAGDAAGRLGGDEFGALIAGGDAGAVDAVQSRLDRAIERVLEGTGANVSASLGAAICPTDATEQADLMRIADERLYDAKRSTGLAR
jgi:diguanylate cyclase (GGDEF)-like protein